MTAARHDPLLPRSQWERDLAARIYVDALDEAIRVVEEFCDCSKIDGTHASWCPVSEYMPVLDKMLALRDGGEA